MPNSFFCGVVVVINKGLTWFSIALLVFNYSIVGVFI